ncbi:insulin-like peptide INSL6 [Pteronotus mesoamericanus]|uniref:insulin-like peptide INSL6 n=1 Tax=Pteronotus mesoamericanus TaxID=1884717 RepID=UPI0023EC50B1|nr:insulin-like peptide INSL6 [Pteronotus parnellii mesoamericanus]
MPRLLCFGLLGLWLLPLRLSDEQSSGSRARKLCGRHLLERIVKLCGDADWSHFEENTPFKTQLIPQTSKKSESFIPDRLKSSQTTARVWGKGTSAVSTSASQKESINNVEMQSPPEHQYKKDYLLPNKTREFASSQDIDSYVHEIIEYQKKNTNKIKTLRKLIRGNHPQRIRRGYSEKCCLKGCTKEELIVACLPYIDYKNLKKGASVVTEIH